MLSVWNSIVTNNLQCLIEVRAWCERSWVKTGGKGWTDRVHSSALDRHAAIVGQSLATARHVRFSFGPLSPLVRQVTWQFTSARLRNREWRVGESVSWQCSEWRNCAAMISDAAVTLKCLPRVFQPIKKITLAIISKEVCPPDIHANINNIDWHCLLSMLATFYLL